MRAVQPSTAQPQAGPPPEDPAFDSDSEAPRRAPSRLRARLSRLLHRRGRVPKGATLAAACVFALAGAMFVASARASVNGSLRTDVTGGLRGAIEGRAQLNSELSAQVRTMNAEVERLKSDPAESEPLLAASQTRAAALAPMVGTTEVRGPGVTVTLDDAPVPAEIPGDLTGDDYLVHQQDLQGVVNALWRGGASGVTVMGERLVATSAVRCVGNTVILHGRVFSPPFVVRAVGDVNALEAALDDDDSVQFFRQWASVVGLGYSQVPSRSLVLPAYSGPLSAEHATVVE